MMRQPSSIEEEKKNQQEQQIQLKLSTIFVTAHRGRIRTDQAVGNDNFEDNRICAYRTSNA